MSYPPPVSPGPQQPQYAQQPYQPAHFTPPPKKKSNAGLIIGIVAAVVVVLCGSVVAVTALAGGGTDTPPAASGGEPAGEEPKDAAKTYKLGQPVRGGDFEFTVHSNKCGIAQVGSEYLSHKPQGTFCRIDVTVKNVTNKAQLFHADGTVKAKDKAGTEFSADGEAAIYGNKEGAGFLDEINPGNQVRAFVYFDVPKGTKLATVHLDAGLFTLAEDAVVTL